MDTAIQHGSVTRESSEELPLFRGELALAIAVVINTFGVVLMLLSGSGISAISSVPYALTDVMPFLTLGEWTYLFQGVLIATLMVLRKRFVLPYLLSFVVGFFFSCLLDFHKWWTAILPTGLALQVIYFIISYLLICIGIALSNRCGLPIIPTDLFPRELAQITKVSYAKIKIGFDATCLIATAATTYFCLGHVDGLGVGTVLAALTMGKTIGVIGGWMDKHFRFATWMTLKKQRAQTH
ncbi:MAG: DUF6198 family protein [Acutalibacter sp.]|jgi:uncharacterized membrane protein YczE